MPTGEQRAGRAPRLTAEETRQRMIATGVEMVVEQGLKVDFTLLSLEEVIARAGVARAAVYRYWPTKTAYFNELLLEIAGLLKAPLFQPDGVVAAFASLDWRERTTSPAGRRSLAVEVCRVGARATLDQMVRTTQYGTRLILSACAFSLGATELGPSLAATLQQTELAQREGLAATYDRLQTMLGFRFKPWLSPMDVAELGATYLVGYAYSEPLDLPAWRTEVDADPFGTGDRREWHLAEYGFTTLVMSLVDVVPQDEYDAGPGLSALAALMSPET